MIVFILESLSSTFNFIEVHALLHCYNTPYILGVFLTLK